MGEVDGLDVGERSRMTKHFDVEGANEMLLQLALGDVLFGEPGFQGTELIEYDFVLFLFGFGFANALDELLELLRHV